MCISECKSLTLIFNLGRYMTCSEFEDDNFSSETQGLEVMFFLVILAPGYRTYMCFATMNVRRFKEMKHCQIKHKKYAKF